MNFLKETIEAIQESGHKFEDVMFIGSSDGKYRMNWDKFTQKANFEYDNSWGSQKIAVDLIIYFKDKSYIIRGEYDGSEWWEYNKPKVFNENDTSTDKKTKLENMTDILNLAKIIESYDELEPKLREILNEKARKDKWGERCE